MAATVINIVNNWTYGDGLCVRHSIYVQFDAETTEDGAIRFFKDKVTGRFISVEKGNSYRESTDKDYIVKATPSKIIALYKKFNHDIDAETIKRYDMQAIEDAHSEYLNKVFMQSKIGFKKELVLLLDKYNIKLELNYAECDSAAYLDFVHIPTNKKDCLLIADEGECVTFE